MNRDFDLLEEAEKQYKEDRERQKAEKAQKQLESLMEPGCVGYSLTREGKLWTVWTVRDGKVFHTIPDVKAIALNNLRLAIYEQYAHEPLHFRLTDKPLPEGACVVYGDYNNKQVIVRKKGVREVTPCCSKIDVNQRVKIKIVQEIGLLK